LLSGLATLIAVVGRSC